jgi:hypothetical protein
MAHAAANRINAAGGTGGIHRVFHDCSPKWLYLLRHKEVSKGFQLGGEFALEYPMVNAVSIEETLWETPISSTYQSAGTDKQSKWPEGSQAEMEKAIIEEYKVMVSNNVMTQYFSHGQGPNLIRNLRADTAYRLALLEQIKVKAAQPEKVQALIDAIVIVSQVARESKEGK